MRGPRASLSSEMLRPITGGLSDIEGGKPEDEALSFVSAIIRMRVYVGVVRHVSKEAASEAGQGGFLSGSTALKASAMQASVTAAAAHAERKQQKQHSEQLESHSRKPRRGF